VSFFAGGNQAAFRNETVMLSRFANGRDAVLDGYSAITQLFETKL
jgi:hypothetical protein